MLCWHRLVGRAMVNSRPRPVAINSMALRLCLYAVQLRGAVIAHGPGCWLGFCVHVKQRLQRHPLMSISTSDWIRHCKVLIDGPKLSYSWTVRRAPCNWLCFDNKQEPLKCQCLHRHVHTNLWGTLSEVADVG